MYSTTKYSPCLGIDLGSHGVSVAAIVKGKVQLINDDQGNRKSPSYISFAEQQIYYGQTAQTFAGKNKQNTFYGFRNMIGRNFNDPLLQQDLPQYPFKIEQGPRGGPAYLVKSQNKSKRYSAQELIQLQLRRIKMQSQLYFGQTITKAVISVPAYFSNKQRIQLTQAAQRSGLEVMRLINEPTSACMAYGLHQGSSEKKVVVVDLGQTLNVTVLAVDEGIFEIIGTARNTQVGGRKLDQLLQQYTCNYFQTKSGINISQNYRAQMRLLVQCQRVKKMLSFSNQAQIQIDSLADGYDLVMSITRQKFLEICMPTLKMIVSELQNVLKGSGTSKKEIQDIILSGGGCRIPRVQQILKEFFNRQELTCQINPEEVVVHGAAIQSEALCSNSNSSTNGISNFIDVNPLSFGVRTEGDLLTIVMPRNSTVPSKFTKIFTTAMDNQKTMMLRIFEGERTLIKDSFYRGCLKLQGLAPHPRGLSRIEVTFDMSPKGILTVIAKDLLSGSSSEVSITEEEFRLKKEDIAEAIEMSQKMKQQDDLLRRNLQLQNNFKNLISYVRACLNSETVRIVKSPQYLDGMSALIADFETYMAHNQVVVTAFYEENEKMLRKLFEELYEEIELKGGAGAQWSQLREWRNEPSITQN